MINSNAPLMINKSTRLFVVCCISAILFLSNANAQIRENEQENSERLNELRKQIEETAKKAETLKKQAVKVREEIAEIQQQLINSAADIQKTEDQIIKGESNLEELLIREKNLEEQLKTKNFEMASTLGAMQRLSIQQTNVVAFKPGDAIDTLRTTSLLKVILPDLKGRAELLENDLDELNEVRYEINKQNTELKQQLTSLVIANNDIDVLLKKRMERQNMLESSTAQEHQKLKQFAENAKDLQDLIDQIETEIALRDKAAEKAAALRDRPSSSGNTTNTAIAPIPRDGTSFASSKGNLPLPARGTIGQSFNQLLTTGSRAKGITIDTRAGATVIAPNDGRIEFAGKFRTYGELLIISHGDGYHTLLAGMENINSIVGQWVLKGEPVGQMSNTTGLSNSRQKLYVELRQKGKPVNPLPWMVAMNSSR